MRLNIILILTVLVFSSCVDPEDDFYEYDFEPQSVLVKTNAKIRTPELFNFINAYGLEIETIWNAIYVSDLEGNQLEDILQDLNTRGYIVNDPWKATGYLHYQTGQIHVSTRFFDILKKENQTDWLEMMEKYRLKENFIYDHSGFVIHFKAHVGKEKHWARYFRKLDFVEWAELDYYMPITPG